MNEFIVRLKTWFLERLKIGLINIKELTVLAIQGTLGLIFAIIGLIGLVAAVLLFIPKIIQEFNSQTSSIAAGYNYILLTLLIFIGFCRWQLESLKSDLSMTSKPVPSKTAMVIVGISLIPTVWVFFSTFFGIYFQIGKSVEGIEFNFFDALLTSISRAGITYGAFLGLILFVFRLGIFTSGLSISISLHNYFNGMGFDLSIFWNIFDLSLSDFWGAVVTIANLLVTYLVGRKLHFSE